MKKIYKKPECVALAIEGQAMMAASGELTDMPWDFTVDEANDEDGAAKGHIGLWGDADEE